MFGDLNHLETAQPSRQSPSKGAADPAPQLLKHPRPQSHLVQFYGKNDLLMSQNVGRYLAAGLKLDGAVVIGSSQRNQAVALEIDKLGIDSHCVQGYGRLRFLDAEETLARFMVGGEPYWGRFEQTIAQAINEIREAVGHGGLRAYGEMVGVLWTQGQYAAAIRLEQFWNRLLARSSASLFCGYPIDLSSPPLTRGPIDAILCTHTHVIPGRSREHPQAADPASLSDRTGEIPAWERQFLRPASVKM